MRSDLSPQAGRGDSIRGRIYPIEFPATLDEQGLTAYLFARAAPNPSRIASRAAAGPLSPMVRWPWLVATRASAGAARKGPRGSPRAADRADRRRQDAGRIFADAGGAFFSG